MLIALAVTLLAFLALVIADAALSIPGESWSRTLRPARLVLTVGLAAALPLIGLTQIVKWGAALAARPPLVPAPAEVLA